MCRIKVLMPAVLEERQAFRSLVVIVSLRRLFSVRFSAQYAADELPASFFETEADDNGNHDKASKGCHYFSYLCGLRRAN